MVEDTPTYGKLNPIGKKQKKGSVIGVGFEPTPPKRLVPKTSALDHSAIEPLFAIRSLI